MVTKVNMCEEGAEIVSMKVSNSVADVDRKVSVGRRVGVLCAC